MRDAIRRVLWMAPTLVATSVFAFWVLSSRLPALDEDVPLFFNPEPKGIREHAAAAVLAAARGGEESENASARLADLGGAALPHVLPRLDELDPAARGRVAIALAPVAARMGIGQGENLDQPDAAVAFWTRFWRDRSIDFHPNIVRRLVRRYAERPSSLRRSEILQLDTFALGDLIRAMDRAASEDDVRRIARLDALARHVIGAPPRAELATIDDAARAADEWRRYWSSHEARLTSLDGARRAAAMIGETRYGRWVGDLARRDLGTTADGIPVAQSLAARAPATLALAILGLLASQSLGVALALLGVLGRRTAAAAAGLAVVTASLPAGALARLGGADAWNAVLAPVAMVAVGAAVASRHAWDAAAANRASEWARALRAQGAGPARVALRAIRAECGRLAALAAPDFPAFVTAAFVVERALSIPGLAEPTLGAIQGGDVAWLLSVALVLTTCAALLQIAGDAANTSLSPPTRLGRERLAGGSE